MVLLLDNYDSFVYNIEHALRQLGASVRVVRNDSLSTAEAVEMNPSHLVISPGPGRPQDAGRSLALISAFRSRIPILGICLGHQCVAEAYGGAVVPSASPTHGRASRIEHAEVGILKGIPSPFEAGRYHSLTVEPRALPKDLESVAWTADGQVMGIWDRSAEVWGLQFHPESILTPTGGVMLEAFLALERLAPAGAAEPLKRTSSAAP